MNLGVCLLAKYNEFMKFSTYHGMQRGACKERMVSAVVPRDPWRGVFINFGAVKFIARMQWVVCSINTCVVVYTYADNRLTEIKRFQVYHKFSLGQTKSSLAVHPTLPYLLSSSKAKSEDNLIQLLDWDKGWTCIRKFKCSRDVREMTFDPKDAYSFASLNYNGEINVHFCSFSPLISLLFASFATADHHVAL
jgi:hypothetical protein